MNDNSLTGACLLNISKYFLLKKLEMYGNSLINIIDSQVTWKKRKQMVYFQKDWSDL